MRRPRSSTLFPYTTLFRSVHRTDVDDGDALVAGIRAAGPSHIVEVDLAGNLALDEAVLPLGGTIATYASGNGSDRKSTRLNSSHMSISYAVFCLKKKKQPR